MTWYASEILAKNSPALLAAIRNDPRLLNHSYLVREPLEYSIQGVQAIFVPPDNGLLVIRPICDPEAHCAEWHDSSILSWHLFANPHDVQAIRPQALDEYVDPELANEFPPPAFLAYLKKLAADTNTNLAFFYCFMWGGDTEVEYAWRFGEREEAAVVLEPGVKSKLVQIGIEGKVEIREVDLLSDTLAYLGAPIPSPFWFPHMRGFPWEFYKLLPSDAE